MEIFYEIVEGIDIALSWRRDREFPEVGFFIDKFVVVARLADESVTEFVVKEGTGVEFGKLGLLFVQPVKEKLQVLFSILLPGRPELSIAVSNQELKIIGTDGLLVGFGDFLIIDESGPGDLFGVFSTVKSDENFGHLAVETFSRDKFAVFGVLDTSKVVLIFDFRKRVEHLNNWVQVTRVADIVHASVVWAEHEFVALFVLKLFAQGEVQVQVEVHFGDGLLCFFLRPKIDSQ